MGGSNVKEAVMIIIERYRAREKNISARIVV
jgi:hypothetical protein